MSITLTQGQIDALRKMKNGCLVCGKTGSGKTITSLAYFHLLMGGWLNDGDFRPMSNPLDLYIITTASTRDKHGWEKDMIHFLLAPEPELNHYKNKVVVDSWNNILKYTKVENAFFIFDEQKTGGGKTWAKAFIDISKKNRWIMLSATPGDKWVNYWPVFVANGFYRNKTDFERQHVIYNPHTPYRSIDRYVNVGRLIRLRNNILVDVPVDVHYEVHHEDIWVDYNKTLYKKMLKERWNIWTDEPMRNANELCLGLRRIVNSDESRLTMVLEILEKHPKAIIFYNYNYELELLKNLFYGPTTEIAEWNGNKHQDIPDSDAWIYLVQYNAGAEGWNCIKTDTIIFFSLNYSYSITSQAEGRITRLNTPFDDLYFYYLKSHAGIDLAIVKALAEKKDFNEGKFTKGMIFEKEN